MEEADSLKRQQATAVTMKGNKRPKISKADRAVQRRLATGDGAPFDLHFVESQQGGEKEDLGLDSSGQLPLPHDKEKFGNGSTVDAKLRIDQEEYLLSKGEGNAEELQIVPGMVLLRNYLSPQDQQEIVDTIRDLGVGPGGFYKPSYASGAKCRLQMMCLGKVRTRN